MHTSKLFIFFTTFLAADNNDGINSCELSNVHVKIDKIRKISVDCLHSGYESEDFEF